jgi:transposase
LTEVATIVDIVRLKEQGLSKRAIAKRLGISRTTVSKYWAESTNPDKPRYARRPQLIDSYRDYITSRLDEYPELSAYRLYKEIKEKGFQGSDRTVRRYVQSLRPPKHREYKPYETLPGEQAQVDWGHFGTIIENGARYKLYAFVFTLCWSRVSYVEFIVRADMATFLSCMNRAFEYIGGVPREVLFDNAKVVVSERVGKIVRFNQDLLHYALSAGFTPQACWINDPESKGKVESQVKYVRRGFFYGRKFKDLDHLNHEVLIWCNNEANPRVHGTTHEIPWDRLATEKHHLKPLLPITMPYIMGERRATRTSMISVEGNQYSVPACFASRKVRFKRFEKHLELLDGQKIIDKIPLIYGRGKRIIRDEHYPEHQRARSRKTASHPLQAKFEALAPEAPAYLQGLSQSRVGTLREQMQSIVELSRDYSPAAISQAMQRALEFQSFGYGVLKRILKRQASAPESLPESPLIKTEPLPENLNVQVEKRDLAYYDRLGAAL